MKKLLKAVLKGFLIVFAISIILALVGLFGTFVYNVFDYIATINEWSQELRQTIVIIAILFFFFWGVFTFVIYSDPFNGD